MLVSCLVVAILGFAFFIRGAKPPAYMGWCCMTLGQDCRGASDAPSCGGDGGIAFSENPVSCSVACGSHSINAGLTINAR